ncbi:MAG: CDP-alcohol phosphatidyltransferase family protein [Clostridiales bacterium]|nr:CDP-alcohol phosphatidyltransferase family protein [Clostridiales bacterium]
MKARDNQNTLKEEFKISKSELLAIPNILCYLRLLLIPLFMILYIKAETKDQYYFAGFVVLLASFTDFLDGFIARKFNMITEFGKLLDPLADKLMQAALILVLILEIDYMYLLALVFIIKELIMTIAAYVFVKKGKKLDGSKWFGKVSTTIFYVTMLILIVLPSLNKSVTSLLMIICGLFLTLSFVLYGREYYIMYKELKEENK